MGKNKIPKEVGSSYVKGVSLLLVFKMIGSQG
jgi:hypothetical protein